MSILMETYIETTYPKEIVAEKGEYTIVGLTTVDGGKNT